MKKFKSAVGAVAAMAFFILGGHAAAPRPDEKCGVDFQILTDRNTYSPASTMRVKFLVTNTGNVPVYFFRGLSECSSQLGSFLLSIVDINNHIVNHSGCSSDYLIDKMDVVTELTAADFGIKLKAGEIFGVDTSFELPAKNGVYRLKAELVPAAFTSEQREILNRNAMRVLQERCVAPVATVTVR